MNNLEARVEWLEQAAFGGDRAALEARLAALEGSRWSDAGNGGYGGGGETTCIVRVTVAAAAATAPAYTTGTGVLQADPGATPYADVSGAPTVVFNNDHDKIIKTGYYAKLVVIYGAWWVLDVSSCNGLG